MLNEQLEPSLAHDKRCVHAITLDDHLRQKRSNPMKISSCLACKHDVSDEAISCPNCGLQWPTGRPAHRSLSEVRSHVRKQSAYRFFRAILHAWLVIVLLSTIVW